MIPEPASGAAEYYVRSLHHYETFTNSTAFDGWDLEYTQLSAGRYECQSKEVSLPGVQIYTETGNVTSNQCGVAWPNSYIFALPSRMGHEARLNGRSWGGEIVAFRGENEYDALVPPMKLLIIAISRDILAEYLRTVEHVSEQEWLKRGMLLIENPVRASSIIGGVTGLIEGCCADPSLLDHPQTRAAVRQTTMEILAPLVVDHLVPAPIGYREFNHLQVVRRAREFVLENIDEPLQIVDVCRALGVSRRALQYSFQDVLNTNPNAYLRLLRLNGARRDLVTAGERPIQVKDVVARWGFWHLSRFSAEYRQMFNELPSETLRKALRAAGRE